MVNKKTRKRKSIIEIFISLIIIIGTLSILFITLSVLANDQSIISNNSKGLSEQVVEYQPLVEEHLEVYNKEQYTGIVLSLMMQESGGRGSDPMQASESYCGEVGCITNPNVSIEKGVAYFVEVLDKAEGDVKLALQSYNFGIGFITYVLDNGGVYTEELAIAFSQKKYQELKHTGIYSCLREEAKQYDACYGDILYVNAVLDYYPDALKYTDDTVQVAILN